MTVFGYNYIMKKHNQNEIANLLLSSIFAIVSTGVLTIALPVVLMKFIIEGISVAVFWVFVLVILITILMFIRIKRMLPVWQKMEIEHKDIILATILTIPTVIVGAILGLIIQINGVVIVVTVMMLSLLFYVLSAIGKPWLRQWLLSLLTIMFLVSCFLGAFLSTVG